MKPQIKAKVRECAQALAEELFYSNDECEMPWPPFEGYDDEWVRAECEHHASRIEEALLTLLGEIK